MHWVQIVAFAGILIGAAIVTLPRIRHASQHTTTTSAPLPTAPVAQADNHLADDVLAATRSQAAMAREMASYAAALGSSRKSWH
jgi:hypothetical protein